MACPPPESWGHQFAVVLGPIHRHIGALNILWFLPPYLAVAICTTEEVLLVVGHSEDVIADQTQHQDSYGINCAQLDRVVNQIQTLGSRKKKKDNQWFTLNICAGCHINSLTYGDPEQMSRKNRKILPTSKTVEIFQKTLHPTFSCSVSNIAFLRWNKKREVASMQTNQDRRLKNPPPNTLNMQKYKKGLKWCRKIYRQWQTSAQNKGMRERDVNSVQGQ